MHDNRLNLVICQNLRAFKLLEGVRGQPPADLNHLASQIAGFSRMLASLSNACREIDINPLMCTQSGAVALDCLVVTPSD